MGLVSTAGAQTSPAIQKIHCSAVSSCSFSNPVTSGDLLIVSARTTQSFVETSGASWSQSYLQGWYGAYDSLYYATATSAGVVTVQFASAIADISMLEYPGAVLSQQSSQVELCCAQSAPVGPVTTPSNGFLILLINPSAPDIFSVPSFNLADSGGGIVIMDQAVNTGSYSASVPQGHSEAWGAKLFAFTFTAPPAPSIPLAVNTGSTAVYDDATPVLPGPVTVSQLQNPTTTAVIGTISSDTSGNLSGSITVNPNWADANGNLNFVFSLPVVPNLITYPVPVGEFAHGSTGLTINLVLFKQGPLGIKLQTLAVTP